MALDDVPWVKRGILYFTVLHMSRLSTDELEGLFDLLTRNPSESLETETIEFKEFRDFDHIGGSKELAEEISGLANRSGGVILIGVRDSSNVSARAWSTQLVGFPKVDNTLLRERFLGRIRPAIDLTLSNFSYGGKNFLVILVPHKRDVLVGTAYGKYCIREGRSCRPMRPDEVQDAVRAQFAHDWSGEALEASVDTTLDAEVVTEALADFVRRRQLTGDMSIATYLESVGATSNGVLTKGGLLFLGRTQAIKKFLGDYEFRFSWKTKGGELIINDVWQGGLWAAVGRAKQHFGRCNKTLQFKFKGSDYEAPLLDPIAFHEAYLNALVHRDYATDGMVTVNFSDDRLTITSPGGFYGGITADNIGFHEPRHRNKALARVLMNHHMVDRAGMGVLRMSLRSLRYGRRMPEFREVLDSVEVTMDAAFFRPKILVLTSRDSDKYGLPELLILNGVYETGVIEVPTLLAVLEKQGPDAWTKLQKAVRNMDEVEFCGTKSGLHIRVKPAWADFFQVTKQFDAPSTSKHHVKLYQYLRKHGAAANSDITSQLGYKQSSQTSRFLREALYVERTGNGRSAQWSIKQGY